MKSAFLIIFATVLTFFSVTSCSVHTRGGSGISSQEAKKEGLAMGVFVPGGEGNLKLIHDLETKIGKKFVQIMWYEHGFNEFPMENCRELYGKGYIPHIVWELGIWKNKETGEELKFENILNGEWDKIIQSWANGAAEFGKPIIIRWGHEFNGNWYPWSVAKNGEDPEKYIRTYRYIHRIFDKAGAQNVLWAWSPNVVPVPQAPWNDWLKAYPGDDYVDWIAVDGYNFGTKVITKRWDEFYGIYVDFYKRALKEINKPIMLGEFASGSDGGDKAQWLRDMDRNFKEDFPAIKSFSWFNINKETDWRLEETPKTIKAAKEIFSDPYYLGEQNSIFSVTEQYYRNRDKYIEAAEKLQPSDIW